MNPWLIGECVLLLVLVIAWWRRQHLAHFQTISMSVCALLVAICLAQSLLEGPRPFTLGLGALAVSCFAIELVRQMRSARRRPS